MTIRTQAQLHQRHKEARNEAEALEYDRCYEETAEGYKNIDATAKRFLNLMLRNIQQHRRKFIQENIACYVAWKWMLGHPDADYFPGAHGKPLNLDPHVTHSYLREQIESGEWDRMTKQAVEGVTLRKLLASIERKLQATAKV